MGYMVRIKNERGSFVPEDKDAEQIQPGDFLKVPSGRIYLYKSDSPCEIVLVSPEDVPEGARVVNFRKILSLG
ncbi:MAG TPA: hypothetical protein VLH94_04520 [Spirochaetia bacterium]|nr:hypothetical protein [Spirochaetia bacterium]